MNWLCPRDHVGLVLEKMLSASERDGRGLHHTYIVDASDTLSETPTNIDWKKYTNIALSKLWWNQEKCHDELIHVPLKVAYVQCLFCWYRHHIIPESELAKHTIQNKILSLWNLYVHMNSICRMIDINREMQNDLLTSSRSVKPSMGAPQSTFA